VTVTTITATPVAGERQRAAQDRAAQIRLNVQRAAVLYVQAVLEQDWQALGYGSVPAWAAGEFGPDRFSAARRREIVALLTGAGYTIRQIAAATGAARSTVNNDQGALGLEVPHPTGRQRAALDLNARRQREAAELADRERQLARQLLAQWADRELRLLQAVRDAAMPLPVLDDLLSRLAAYRKAVAEARPGAGA
jgi:transposase-like protein